MATIDWGNTRAPMHPEQHHGYSPQQSGHGSHQSGYMGQEAMHPHQQAHAYAQPHEQTYADPHSAAAPAFGAPPAYAHQAQSQFPQGEPYAGYGYDAGHGGGGSLPPAASGHSRATPLINYAGAAVSLALVIGLGVWGYQLAMRDVTGIPVVRALEGPMRIQPSEPGGQAAAHQGLAVNAVQAEGQASAPSDRVALAPAPEALSEEDSPANPAAMSARDAQRSAPVAEPLAEPIEVAAQTTPEVVELPEINMKDLPADPVAAALAIADQISKNAAPLSGGADAEVSRAAAQSPVDLPAATAKQPKIIPASVPGVSRSKRPLVRPANLSLTVPVKAALSQPATTGVTEVAPEKIAAGTRLVQLGAYDNADVARAEWVKLSERFEDYLPGKTRVIQKAQSGGKTFYRLRAMGFKDLADARRFCSALMAGKAACIPVVTR